MPRTLPVLGVLALSVVATVLVLPSLAEGPPVFVIEHEIAIDASAAEVWAVLTDFDAYPEWNPYARAISGDALPGGIIEITISQDNWSEPLTLLQTVIAREDPALFHWHGSVAVAGLLETDHSFQIEALGPDRVRFVQREEFRGAIAGLLEADARVFTQRAFQAMDEALADRVVALRAPN